MIEKVTKEPITDIRKLRVGQMITQDYQKPTQRALTVVEKRNGVVWLESRQGEQEIQLTQAELDAGTYDLQTTPQRRSL